MSWTDEEIDKLAQDSAANNSFKYKDEYFAEFEAMLPKGGRNNFTWFFTAFLFVGLMSTSLIFNGFFKSNQPQLANEVINETAISDVNFKNENSINERNNTTENNSTNTEEKNELNDKKDLLNEKVHQNKLITNSNLTKKNTVRKKSVSLSSKVNLPTTIDISILDIALGKEEKEIEADVISNNREVITNEIISEKSMSESINDINSENDSDVASLNFNEENNILEKGIVSKLPLLGLTDISLQTELVPLTLHNERELPAIATFYVEAFGGLSESLITPSEDVTTSFGLGLGAQIQKGRFTFTTGINGVWSNHKDLNLTRSAKVYGFGSNQFNYEFKYKQIYTLEAELSMGYKLGKHLLNVGVRPSIIVGTKVAIRESIDDNATIDRNEYGYVNGLKRFGIKPMIGYSYDLTSSLKIGANIGVELMPKIEEGFLEGTSNRFPIDGQIYLRHSIKFKR